MTGKRPKEIVSYNMSRIHSKGTKLETKLQEILMTFNRPFIMHPSRLFGKPDFVFEDAKVAIFADSDFWHGYSWEKKKTEIKTNPEFWYKKIERNIERDREVTETLGKQGYSVIRLWGHDILRNPEKCRMMINEVLNSSNS
jgi:DNA mismatch endonuclease Vsr